MSTVIVSEQTAKDIGEIKGLLEGVTRMIVMNQEALNRRIDDMSRSNHQRFDDISSALGQRLDVQDDRLGRVENCANEALRRGDVNAESIEAIERQAAKTGGSVGAVAGAVVAGALELIKAAVKG